MSEDLTWYDQRPPIVFSTYWNALPGDPFECCDVSEFALICITVGRLSLLCPHIYHIEKWVRGEGALGGHGFTVKSHPRGNVRCVKAVAPCNVRNLFQENCEPYILAKSPVCHAEGFLPNFDWPIHFYSNPAKRGLSAICRVPTNTKILKCMG